MVDPVWSNERIRKETFAKQQGDFQISLYDAGYVTSKQMRDDYEERLHSLTLENEALFNRAVVRTEEIDSLRSLLNPRALVMQETQMDDGHYITNLRIERYIADMYYGDPAGVVAQVISRVAKRVRDNLEGVISDKDAEIFSLKRHIEHLKGARDG